jgi:hypothetical protein
MQKLLEQFKQDRGTQGAPGTVPSLPQQSYPTPPEQKK